MEKVLVSSLHEEVEERERESIKEKKEPRQGHLKKSKKKKKKKNFLSPFPKSYRRRRGGIINLMRESGGENEPEWKIIKYQERENELSCSKKPCCLVWSWRRDSIKYISTLLLLVTFLMETFPLYLCLYATANP